jgi:hypothetical protein
MDYLVADENFRIALRELKFTTFVMQDLSN